MIVVADTSPLNCLILIDEAELLPAMFGRVLIPTAVLQELRQSKAPVKVRDWVAKLPAWLEVRNVKAIADVALMRLDLGEREAIQLAMETGVGMVLIDEADGRRQAERLHLEVRGTLGVLERGAKLGKTNFRRALSKLEQTTFRLSPTVREAFLKRNP